MPCFTRCSHAFALSLLFTLFPLSGAFAHCFVGARFLPATEWGVGAEISKRITEDFGISIGDTWRQIRAPGGPTMAGFDNLETTVQYQLLKDGPHEFAALLGLVVDWGGTGASNSGIATPWTVLTPTYYFGKGFGDLPEQAGWLRA